MTIKIALTRKDRYQQVLEEKSMEFKTLFHLNHRDIFEINLILDEVCTNIFEYNPETEDLFIKIEATCEDDLLQMIIRDNGIPFQPTAVAAPDTRLPLEKRKAGGLGLMLVKRYTDTIAYKRLKGLNQTTLTKKLR
ncbi:ATP-binding protein [Desulfopila inferna]|uniref:ATP-binding protein n=1 Tax=Desulfopila inferna TaxID=468528 RepID=UPI00196671AC|nr:ATP-binding protein [Desulfopila inferna]MBM9603811.1 ATP-binding protein [Desulfopila inferna]